MNREVTGKSNWIKTFGYAFSGIKWAIIKEKNFKIHLLAAFFAVALGVYFKITLIEWGVLSFTIFLVLAFEMMNTAVEKTIDLVVGKEYHSLAKIAKDVAAGAVLLTAINSVIIGLIIFGKRLINLIEL